MSEHTTIYLRPEYRLSEESLPTNKTQRKFLDFVVDGISLWQLTQDEGLDLVSCLILPDIDSMTVRKLLAQEPSELSHNRYALYICPECGDLGCGALTVHIELVGDVVIWRDFAFQNNYDEEIYALEKFQHLGPFHFERQTYMQLLRNLAQS